MTASGEEPEEPPSRIEILDRNCAFYMAIGMTWEQYWFSAPIALRIFRESYELKKAQENERLHLQGLYNYNAFSAALDQFGWAFAGGKGKRPEGYMKDPLPITEEQRKQKEKRDKEERIRRTIEFFQKGQEGG